MTERENALLVYNHKKPQWTPILTEAVHFIGLWANNECGLRGEKTSETTALDAFGVEWELGHGSPVPVPGKYILDDISNWRTLKFPEPKTWDWEMMRDIELKNYDGTKLLTYFCEQGLFDRLTALLGFENALVALITDPEECHAFFDRMVQYKIEIIECAAKYYKPDVFMYTDDVAKSDSLFMSPNTYREVIKPHHQKIIQAIIDNGMIPEQHTCGKFDAIIDDYAEMGIRSVLPAQSSNDVVSILKKYGDRLIVTGGYNSQGPAGRADATAEILKAEARRMAENYATLGNYICLPLIGDFGSPSQQDIINTGIVCEEFRKCCNELGI